MAAGEDQRTGDQRRDRIREARGAELRHARWTEISERHPGERGYDMQAIADGPSLDEQAREQARGMIQRLGRFTIARFRLPEKFRCPRAH